MLGRYCSLLLLTILATTPAQACDWLIVAGASRVGFVAEQQRAHFRGEFETFAAELRFDPVAYANGQIIGIVKTASVNTGNAERDDYLRSDGTTRDVTFSFEFSPGASEDEARLQGYMDIQRLDFGIGQGEWRNTDWVGNDVRIEVALSLKRP